MTYVLPRLSTHEARGLIVKHFGKSLAELRENAMVVHPRATFAAIGERLSATDLQTLMGDLRQSAESYGYPDKTPSADSRRRWDVDAAGLLWEALGKVSPAEAGRVDVWTFLCASACPDIVIWRFPWPDGEDAPRKHEPRFVGGRRNVLRRLWWRARALSTVNAEVTLMQWLGEDDLVQIFERTVSAGIPRLPGILIQQFAKLKRAGHVIDIADVMKRLNRELAITAFGALPENEIIVRIEALVAESTAAGA